MNKKQLKEIMRPLVKELMMEALIQEGLLSNIVSEVNKGLRESDDRLIRAHASETMPERDNTETVSEPARLPRKKSKRNDLQEQRQRMLKEMSESAYGGVDIFEGVDPIPQQGTGQQSKFGALRDRDPNDSGIDLSQFGF
jgi:hypothetical protein